MSKIKKLSTDQRVFLVWNLSWLLFQQLGEFKKDDAFRVAKDLTNIIESNLNRQGQQI